MISRPHRYRVEPHATKCSHDPKEAGTAEIDLEDSVTQRRTHRLLDRLDIRSVNQSRRRLHVAVELEEHGIWRRREMRSIGVKGEVVSSEHTTERWVSCGCRGESEKTTDEGLPSHPSPTAWLQAVSIDERSSSITHQLSTLVR